MSDASMDISKLKDDQEIEVAQAICMLLYHSELLTVQICRVLEAVLTAFPVREPIEPA